MNQSVPQLHQLCNEQRFSKKADGGEAGVKKTGLSFGFKNTIVMWLNLVESGLSVVK